jgi:two-component system chemotaxis response regulator CheB
MPSPDLHGRAAEADPLRILIVDDSIVARTVFQRMLDDDAGFAVAGIARNVEQALAMLDRTVVDAVLLDVEMPGTDGITALPAILRAGRGAHVLIVSSACGDGAQATVRALSMGAADTLLKPSTGDLGRGFAERLTDCLRRLGPAGRTAPALATPTETERTAPVRTDPVGCIAIGASTGGPVALAAFFEGLGDQRQVPILVTQHLPAAFMRYFADQMTEMVGRPVTVAQPGQPVAAGQILIAPGTAHLSLEQDGAAIRVRYDDRPAFSGCQPSVDPMLDAVARLYGAAGIGVILSGMGRDGARGAERLVQAGGELMAQDAATATIWGMPGAVARTMLATTVLPPAALGWRIATRLRTAAQAAGDMAGRA